MPRRADSKNRYLIVTLGCKVNQAETASLAGELRAAGLEPAADGAPARLAVLMSCSVTGSAARQSRQMARRLLREHPGAVVAACGCDAQVDPAAYRRLGCAVLGRGELHRLAAAAAGSQPWPDGAAPAAPASGPLAAGVRPPGPERTRGLLKVQDGCDAHCRYCIVPRARGGPRSLEPAAAAAAFAGLGAAGAAEVVLTGIHLGRWGRDLTPPARLDELVRALLAAHPGPRLRLSSLEVSEITPELEGLLAGETRLCPHLHIPLQSGSDAVLRAMGRPYAAADYTALVARLCRALPGLCVGADVLVGLPGEDEAAFLDTCRLIEGLPLAYLHVFPYSPRPGTPAAALPRPPAPEVKQRAARLRALGGQKRRRFYGDQAGRTLTAVVEGGGQARTGNYCLARVGPELPAGAMVAVEVEGVRGRPGRECLVGAVRPL